MNDPCFDSHRSVAALPLHQARSNRVNVLQPPRVTARVLIVPGYTSSYTSRQIQDCQERHYRSSSSSSSTPDTSTRTSPDAAGRSRFLKDSTHAIALLELPAELRNSIYRLALASDDSVEVEPTKLADQNRPHSNLLSDPQGDLEHLLRISRLPPCHQPTERTCQCILDSTGCTRSAPTSDAFPN